jgi:CheY-like chemotaxis protein
MTKRILGVMSDLFFLIKINDAAKKLGITVEFVKDEETARRKIGEKPDAVIFDLSCASVDPFALIRSIKENPETRNIRTVAFLSHVRTDLKRQAEESGCDLVVARSVFDQNLPAILNPQAATEESSRN